MGSRVASYLVEASVQCHAEIPGEAGTGRLIPGDSVGYVCLGAGRKDDGTA